MIDPEPQLALHGRLSTRPAGWIVLGYLLLCFGVWGYWLSHERDYFSGDQPHYLVIASALVDHASFEVTRAYRSEIERDRFRIGMLVESGTDVSDEGIAYLFRAHTRAGPHGLYNVHNIGLPILLSPALVVSEWLQRLARHLGVDSQWIASLPRLGCMAFILLLSGAIPLLAWSFSGLFFSERTPRILTSVALGCAAPFSYAAQQIYPDIPAGIIAAAGLLYCVRGARESETHRVARPVLALLIALLPWLQIRFFAPALLLATACHLVERRSASGRRTRAAWFFPAALLASTLGLAHYNQFAFGQATGPYREGSLSIAPEGRMVLLGLHVDQLHGIFLAQPLMLAAVVGLSALFVRDWRLAALTGALHASFVVPTAMHPNWYGGFSLAGRFGWSGAVVLLVLGLLSVVVSLVRLSYV